jgi:hypothetical protein
MTYIVKPEAFDPKPGVGEIPGRPDPGIVGFGVGGSPERWKYAEHMPNITM